MRSVRHRRLFRIATLPHDAVDADPVISSTRGGRRWIETRDAGREREGFFSRVRVKPLWGQGTGGFSPGDRVCLYGLRGLSGPVLISGSGERAVIGFGKRDVRFTGETVPVLFARENGHSEAPSHSFETLQANPRLVFGSQNDCGLPRGGRIDHRHPCLGRALPPGERREGGNGAGEGWAALGWAGAALLVMAGLSWIVALSRYHGLSWLRDPHVSWAGAWSSPSRPRSFVARWERRWRSCAWLSCHVAIRGLDLSVVAIYS